MKIGNAPISWGICEIPDWGPQLPVDRVLSEMAQAGYAGTELGPWGYLPTDHTILKQTLDRYNLRMASAFVPVDLRSSGRLEEELPQVMQIAELLKALGAEHIILSDSGDGKRSAIAGRLEETRKNGLTDAQWDYFARSLERIAAACQELGLTLCFHSHGGTYVENPDEIERLCVLTDDSLVKLCFDTGHVAFGGGDPAELFVTYGDRIGYVHLKDIRLDALQTLLAEGADYAQAAKSDVFVPLGEGDVDLTRILNTLKQKNFQGWVIVEQDRVVHEGDDSLSAAVTSREYLRRAIGL